MAEVVMPELIINDGNEEILQESESSEADDIEECGEEDN